MVIFLNFDGTAEKVTPQHVYQGSNNVTEITVIAPYAADTAMQIGFILPDGLYWKSEADDARYAPMGFVGQNVDTKACAWTFMLPLSVTEMQGIVQIAINAKTIEGNTTSYLCEMTVEESVLPTLPSAPEPSVYELLQLYLSRLDGRTANVPNLVARIQKASGNGFTYTDNKGVVSAPITLGEIDYNPTYVGVASVIAVPTTAWQPVYNGQTVTGYTLTIAAAQHGQMQDGVTAHDLWLSFDSTSNEVISGAYQGYTVSDAGDITLNVNAPIAMTVRVWNGKGLVDSVAREQLSQEIERTKTAEAQLQAEISAEATRAQNSEANLQTQIDHIFDTGIDKLARAEIAVEIERAKVAEATLNTKIDTNASNIQGLRDDLTEVESYIPSSTSADNQLADKAFVNSSINNLAAFYIEYSVQGDSFPTRAALLGATTFYNAGQPRVPTQNDYAYVLSDESQPKDSLGNYPTTRYSYQGGTYPNGQWGFQYIVNNTSLTQAQVDAINSGITQSLVTQIGDNKTAIAAEITARENADANLQQQIDAIGDSGVTSVNGQTGAVSITPENIGAFSPSNLPTAVKDRTYPSNPTYLNYGGKALTTTSWLGAWNEINLGGGKYEYELRAMTPASVRETINAVNKAGDTMTGALKLPSLQSADKAGTTSTVIIPIPLVPYSLIDPTHNTETYLQNLLKWICTNYPNIEKGVFIGAAIPNSAGEVIIHICNTSDYNSAGLPNYSSGIYQTVSGNIIEFGTNSFNWYFRTVLTSVTKTAQSTNVTYTASSITCTVGNVYSFPGLTSKDYIGGILKYGSLIGYIIDTGRFIALSGGSLSSGNSVTVYYYTIG